MLGVGWWVPNTLVKFKNLKLKFVLFNFIQFKNVYGIDNHNGKGWDKCYKGWKSAKHCHLVFKTHVDKVGHPPTKKSYLVLLRKQILYGTKFACTYF